MLSKLKQNIHTLTHMGLETTDTSSTVRRVLILNRMSVFLTIVCWLFVPLFYWIGETNAALWAAVVATSYFLPILFSYKRRFVAGKVWSILTVTVAAVLYSLILGEEFQIQLALYPAGVLPFIFFGRENPKIVYFSFTTACLGYLVSFYFSDQGQAIVNSDNIGIATFATIMIINSFLMTGAGLYTVNEDARNAEQELTVVNIDKRKLINLLCHDITNPLSLCFFAKKKLGKSGMITEEVTKDFNRLTIGLDNIKKIIDSVRILEAAEVGKLQVELMPVDPKQIISESMVMFEEKLERKKIEIQVINSIQEPFFVLAEPNTLRNNIFNNILSNAIKFSPNGSNITIQFGKYEKGKILIEITDQGIGIPTTLVNRLFDSTAFTTRRGLDGEAGTGFGLPLVKSMTEKFGGRVEVVSRDREANPDNHGTTFKIILNKAA